jgi:hypothetical protein
LGNLPMNGANVCSLVSIGDIHLEVADAPVEVVCIDVPLLLISDINIGGDDSQANEAGCAKDCR